MIFDVFTSPPPERYGIPGINFPTPNPRDLLIIEDFNIQAMGFHGMAYGTPNGKVAECVLCFQSPLSGNNVDKNARRYFANPRLAQEPYNLVNGGNESNDAAYPIFIRSYLLPRNYTKGTIGQPLKALIGLTLTGTGTGYTVSGTSGPNGQLPLSFTGGAGSGAAGYGEVVGGKIVAIFLTNTGTGYTSAPTMGVTGGGGSGFTATALLQVASALLTQEKETPAEEPYGGYFVRVQRTYETVPGPVLTVSQTIEKDSGATITKTEQLDLISAITPSTVIDGSGNLVVTEMQETDSTTYAKRIVTTISDAPAHSLATAVITTKTMGYKFPARVNIPQIDLYGYAIGYDEPEAKLIEATVKTWFVIANTKPTLAFDRIIPNTIWLNGREYSNVLHDGTTRFLGDGTVPWFFPPTTPTDTEYETGWIGQSKLIDGDVKDTEYLKRWKVQAIYLIME